LPPGGSIYNGVVRISRENFERMAKAAVLTACGKIGASLLGAASEYSQRGRGFPAGTAKRAEGYPDNDCQRREPRFQGRSCGANMRSVGAEKAIAD
jgi:hypothetical protein